ncbi:MAG: hypothetical protein ACLPN5_10545 [Roseiarcus sp.]
MRRLGVEVVQRSDQNSLGMLAVEIVQIDPTKSGKEKQYIGPSEASTVRLRSHSPVDAQAAVRIDTPLALAQSFFGGPRVDARSSVEGEPPVAFSYIRLKFHWNSLS